MPRSVLASPSQRKASEYYANSRGDLVARLRTPVGSVLDVGCASGASGEALLEAGATDVVGIEIDRAAAAQARTRYTTVHCAPVQDVVGELHRAFDTILCYDVLEHLVDPAHVLRELRRLSHEGTQLHVSVPNARHLALVRDLVVKGTFGYAQTGHRDSTHLRWFTRKDLIELLISTGWAPTSTAGSKVGKSLTLSNLTAGRLDEFLVLQWQILAAPT